MIRFAFLTLAVLAAQPAIAQSIEVSDGNWADIPFIRPIKPQAIGQNAMDRIDRAITKGKCTRAGTLSKIALDVPFLLQFDSTGKKVERVVVQRIGCPEVEEVVGVIVAARARTGHYKATGQNQTGWYRSEFNYHVD